MPKPEEKSYLDAAPEPLRDVAILILDTGLRLGETLALKWSDVRLEPVTGAKFGFVCIFFGRFLTFLP
ncbi:MAG TPA: hypothetical protein VIW93_10555 [Candidatus Acidoferrum sp.]